MNDNIYSQQLAELIQRIATQPNTEANTTAAETSTMPTGYIHTSSLQTGYGMAGSYGSTAQVTDYLQANVSNTDTAEIDNQRDQDSRQVEAPRQDDKIRPLSVRQLNYGYVVTIGCHEFAISTHTQLTKLLGQYLANPDRTERLWFKGELI